MVSLRNLSSSECFEDGSPWRFVNLGLVPADSFRDKAARDAWINRPATSFNVYTLYEGTQKNLRLRGSKGSSDDANPPHTMHGLAVDYDAAMTVQDVAKAFPLMGDMLPTWFEQTLSGNGRLMWLFQQPLLIPSSRFLQILLENLHDLIPYRKLPGLDEGAFKTPGRYFTNGCRWTMVSRKTVPAALLTGFVMKISEKVNWTAKEFGKAANLPDIAEECARVFPKFAEWPGEFVVGAQGPSFWVDGSTSPKSAIVRETGIQTFSAHATKAFYSWAEIVGAKFVEDTENNRLGKAVEGVYWDGRNFITKDGHGQFAFHTKDNMRLLLAVNKGLKSMGKNGPSECERALAYIMDYQAVAGASSCAFYPKGVFAYGPRRILNTHQIDVCQPAPEPVNWGAEGKMPWLSRYFDTFYTEPIQNDYYFAWLRHFYQACYERRPTSGHSIFISGPVNCGKTFLNRGVHGKMFGGFADANQYLTKDCSFNSELFDYGVWVIDDATVMSSEKLHQFFSEKIKAMVANSDHLVNEKFRKAVMTPWQGRISVTLNDDAESQRMIPMTDLSMLEKIMLFRAAERTVQFFSRDVMTQILDREIPYFCRWLLDWKPPDHVFAGADPRFGVAAYHEGSVLRAANLSSGKTVFVEIVTRWLNDYFNKINPEAEYWEGTATDLRLAMCADQSFGELLRSYKPESFPRSLVVAGNRGQLSIEIKDEGFRRFKIHRCERFGRAKKAQPVPQSEKFQKI